MNHLCNKYCEGCGTDVSEEVSAEYDFRQRKGSYPFVAVYGVGVKPEVKARTKKRHYQLTPQIPVIMTSVGDQQNIASTFCRECSVEISRTAPTYEWNRCSLCGTNVKSDNSTVAFRAIEVNPDFSDGWMIEEHYLKTTNAVVEVISADTTKDQQAPDGAIGWTICVDCMAELSEDASDPETCHNRSTLKHMFFKAQHEGDW